MTLFSQGEGVVLFKGYLAYQVGKPAYPCKWPDELHFVNYVKR
jgi:hypothetical protein